MLGSLVEKRRRRPALVATIVPLLLVASLVAEVRAKPQEIKPGCRYEGKRYAEGDYVGTSEPCLQCRCADGSLRCRLRVCPKLPDPMPPGCRSESPTTEHVCCAKIVCDGGGVDHDDDDSVPERRESENLLQRSKTTAVEAAERPNKEEGCVYEGVRYGPGSAMMGSRRCEYCYCISGARKCIQPKCLLPLPGCVPLYNPHSCCPVAYNCTRQAEFSTTLAAISAFGCRKGQRVYQEGEMVRDIPWKAACDNCFCAMGAIRCVPLACAPPLQGCQPIVRQGQCCPSTYNCSGTIEVKAEQNFASYAFISKDYAKFRKENHYYPAIHDPSLTSIEGRGYRVVNEILAPSLLASGRSSSGGGGSSLADSATEKFSLATDSTTTESIISSDEDGNNDDDAGAEEHDDVDGDGEGGGSSETETMNNEIIGETTDYPKQQQSTTTITTTSGKLELSSEITLDQSVTTTTTTAALAASDNDEQTSNYADAESNTSPPETTPMVSTTVASIASPGESVGGGDIISISMLSSENCSSHGQDDFETTMSDRAAAESTSSVSVNVTEAATTLMPTTSTTAASTTTTTTTTTTTKKPSSSSTTPRIKSNKKNSTSSARPTKKNNGNNRPSKSTQKPPHTKKNTTKRLGASSKIATKNNNSNVIEKSNIVAQVEKSSITCTNGTSDETTTTETSTSTTPATTSTSTTTTSTTTTTAISTTTTTTTDSPEVTTLAYEEEAERMTTTKTTSIDRISVDNEPIMEREKIDADDDNDDEGEKTISMISVKNPSSGLSTSILVPNDMLVMNVTVKTNVAVETIYGSKHQEAANGSGGNKSSISPDVQAILNITRRKGDAAGGAGGEDYEFDYNEPTLPPSLPNVRIIPFVAADALVKDKDGEVVSTSSVATGFPAVGIVPELRNDANFYDIVTQTSRFSPPAKTEGGFVPKDQSHFDALFHSSASDLNLEVSTGVTVAPEEMPVPPNPHRKTDVMSNKCLYEELEYTHGQFLPSRALCVRCICYFGQIICSSRKCPPLKIGCKRISDPNNKCCDNVVCADGVESPTVVLDRADSESSSQHEPTVSPDPFRDVIKTEPAPDLSSLIGEMQPPYLMPEPSLTATATTTQVATTTSSEATPAEDQQQQSLSPPPLTSVDDFSRYNDSHDDDDAGGDGRNETDAAASVSITSKSFSADDVTLTTTDPIVKDNEADDSSIFSLDSVFNLFFDDDRPAETWGEKTTAAANITNSSSIVKVPTPTTITTAATVISSSSTTTTTTTTSTTEPTSTSTSTTEVTFTTLEESSSSEPTTTTTTTPTTTKKPATQADNDPLGLLKLAGCNIYGKMYRVNRIIAELSSDCRECRCSEFGVQCKSLDC